jgi:hypothetical protein
MACSFQTFRTLEKKTKEEKENNIRGRKKDGKKKWE